MRTSGGKPHLAENFKICPKELGPLYLGPSQDTLGLDDIKPMGREHQPTLESSSQSTQGPQSLARKPKAMMYSSLKVNRFLSPPKARILLKGSRPTRRKKLRTLILPMVRGLSLVDEPDPEDDVADSIIMDINGAPHDAQSDKEYLEDDEDVRGPPRN